MFADVLLAKEIHVTRLRVNAGKLNKGLDAGRSNSLGEMNLTRFDSLMSVLSHMQICSSFLRPSGSHLIMTSREKYTNL